MSKWRPTLVGPRWYPTRIPTSREDRPLNAPDAIEIQRAIAISARAISARAAHCMAADPDGHWAGRSDPGCHESEFAEGGFYMRVTSKRPIPPLVEGSPKRAEDAALAGRCDVVIVRFGEGAG